MGKIYNIFLDKKQIGTTLLENADAPMGVTFGVISFSDLDSPYSFFKTYCLQNNIAFEDYPEDKLISTTNIPVLQIFDYNEIEIKGLGCYISGMDSDCFNINIIGIPYPFYEEEFPHHVTEYQELIKKKRLTCL